MKKKVKFLTSIAALADPDRPALDQKYEQMVAREKKSALEAGKECKPGPVNQRIAEHKKSDRYNDVSRGFKRDVQFKTGDEAMIPAEVAVLWEEGGICTILEEPSKKAA